eukprot:392549-Rhodomonas_salina.1
MRRMQNERRHATSARAFFGVVAAATSSSPSLSDAFLAFPFPCGLLDARATASSSASLFVIAPFASAAVDSSLGRSASACLRFFALFAAAAAAGK